MLPKIIELAVYVCLLGFCFWMLKDLIYPSRLTCLARKWIRKWSGHKLSTFERVREFFVYFLDARGEVQSLPVNQFLKLRLPETERPKVWLCYLEVSNQKHEIYLGWPDTRKWKLPTFTSLNGWLNLIDQNDKKIPIGEDKDPRERIKTILEIASRYNNVDEYMMSLIAGYAIPVLEKTKETMGKSPALANIRAALTLGTKMFESKETVDFDRLHYRVP